MALRCQARWTCPSAGAIRCRSHSGFGMTALCAASVGGPPRGLQTGSCATRPMAGWGHGRCRDHESRRSPLLAVESDAGLAAVLTEPDAFPKRRR